MDLSLFLNKPVLIETPIQFENLIDNLKKLPKDAFGVRVYNKIQDFLNNLDNPLDGTNSLIIIVWNMYKQDQKLYKISDIFLYIFSYHKIRKRALRREFRHYICYNQLNLPFSLEENIEECLQILEKYEQRFK